MKFMSYSFDCFIFVPNENKNRAVEIEYRRFSSLSFICCLHYQPLYDCDKTLVYTQLFFLIKNRRRQSLPYPAEQDHVSIITCENQVLLEENAQLFASLLFLKEKSVS